MRILIIGKGAFGSALGKIYSSQGTEIRYLTASDPWPDSFFDTCFLCVPTQELPVLIDQRRASLSKTPHIISTCKGLLQGSNLTPTQLLIKAGLKKSQLFVLSGPSFASEISLGLPTALALGGYSHQKVSKLASKLSNPSLRLYKSHDPVGVEYCGALKNIYAIGAGVSDGLNMGHSARAALCTRALAELSRLASHLGFKRHTVFGLAGVGDLFLTSMSAHSRNYRFGLGLALGKSANSLLKEIGTVEGYPTTSVAAALCKRKKVRAPLITTIDALLKEKITPKDLLPLLMKRSIRHEFE